MTTEKQINGQKNQLYRERKEKHFVWLLYRKGQEELVCLVKFQFVFDVGW